MSRNYYHSLTVAPWADFSLLLLAQLSLKWSAFLSGIDIEVAMNSGDEYMTELSFPSGLSIVCSRQEYPSATRIWPELQIQKVLFYKKTVSSGHLWLGTILL